MEHALPCVNHPNCRQRIHLDKKAIKSPSLDWDSASLSFTLTPICDPCFENNIKNNRQFAIVVNWGDRKSSLAESHQPFFRTNLQIQVVHCLDGTDSFCCATCYTCCPICGHWAGWTRQNRKEFSTAFPSSLFLNTSQSNF